MSMFSYPKELPTMITSNTSEDFSFPVISNNPLSNFMLSTTTTTPSSSLWRISSKVCHLSEDENDDEEEEDYRMEVRSLCEEMLPSRRSEMLQCSSFRREVEEERMDFLWQNFNEEEEETHDCKGGGVVNKSSSNKHIVSAMQGSNKVSKRPSSKLVIGKLLKGLLSFRKSSQLRFSKA